MQFFLLSFLNSLFLPVIPGFAFPTLCFSFYFVLSFLIIFISILLRLERSRTWH
jgi:hypothetical protein